MPDPSRQSVPRRLSWPRVPGLKGATRTTARFHPRSAAACRGAASSWGKPLGSWALRWDGRPRCRPQPLCLWQLPLVGCGASSQQEVEGEAGKEGEITKVSLPPSCLSSILSPQQPRGHCHTNLPHFSCHPPFLGVPPLPGDISASSLFPNSHQSWSNRRLGGAMQMVACNPPPQQGKVLAGTAHPAHQGLLQTANKIAGSNRSCAP